MRYKELAENKKGRDFVLGDLHGCYTILKQLLTNAGFNTETDRLFLVGDLIDRGPESEKCLQLLMEPWCHAVQGNHEQIFCDAVQGNITWMTINDYWQPDYGGGWTREWFERNAPELKFWVSMIKQMPYVIHVKGSGDKKPFWVVHAELWSHEHDVNERNVQAIVENSDADQIRILQWSRMLSKHKTLGRKTTLPGPIHCGHTPTATPANARFGHWNLDAGAGVGPWAAARGVPNPALFLYCHTTGQSFRHEVTHFA